MATPGEDTAKVKDTSSIEEGIEELSIADSGPLPFNLIPCTGPPEDFPDGVVPECSNQPGAAAAHVLREKLWKGRQVLRVFFMNPEVLEGWKCEGTKMTIDLIVGWAGAWEKAPSAPQFKATSNVKKADIRVKCSDKGNCWSLIGMDATTKPAAEPTMMLNLNGGQYPESYLKHLVIHEFGHALGLEHEHQRSDFWDEVKKFVDIDKMKDDERFDYLKTKKEKQAFFGRDYLEKEFPEGTDEYKSEYDSKSIMHYWFDVAWIKNVKYHNIRGITSDSSLTGKQKLYLKGIHDRHNSYAFNPSSTDFKTLEEVYGAK